MSAADNRLLIVKVPKSVMIEALSGLVPSGFDEIMFTHWSDLDESMTIGVVRGDGVPESAFASGVMN